jgi:large subunit ribosomal protein L24
MKKLHQGDEVVVISGRDKGARGTILKRVDDEFFLVNGIKSSKKHQKPNPSKGILGGIVTFFLPVHQSNLMIFNPISNKPDRVRIKFSVDGKKTRVFVSTGDEVKSVEYSK